MPQIVSGLDPKVRLEAFLAGQQSQRALRQQQMAEAESQRAHQAEIMKAILGHHKERQKALADVNAKAQMGDVIAMQQQHAEAQAANKPVEQQDLETAVQIGKGITDPDARALWERDYGALVKRREAEKQRKSSMDVINAAAGDGLIDPKLAEQRLAAGEEPETIAKELKAARDKRDEEELNLQASNEALEHAQHTLAGLPPGSAAAKRVAKIIQRFVGAPTAQRQKDAGKALSKQVLDAAKFQGEEEKAAEQERLGAQDLSAIPAFKGGTHATLRGTNRKGAQDPFAQGPIGYSTQLPPGQEIMDLLNQSKDPADFRAQLRAMGIPQTPEIASLIRQFRQANAAPAAE